MSERMKYNCEACGMYVEAGSGHSCYTPTPPRAELDRERERIAELEAENAELCQLTKEATAELRAENQRLREAATALLADIGDTYDESSGYHRIQVWVDGDLIDALRQALQENGDDSV